MAATGTWNMTEYELWLTIPQSQRSLMEQGSVPVE
jgi:hypothetical protein